MENQKDQKQIDVIKETKRFVKIFRRSMTRRMNARNRINRVIFPFNPELNEFYFYLIRNNIRFHNIFKTNQNQRR